MIRIRGGAGLGDAIYIQSVARHFTEQGQRVEACCDWPDVFSPLGDAVTVSPFRRTDIDRLAHYSLRRGVVGTTQFEDCCIQAGIRGRIPLQLDWVPRNHSLIDRLRRDGRPIIVVQMPRAPFGRTDGYGAELLPDCFAIQRAIDKLSERAFLVQVGNGKPLYRFVRVDLDLANRTSVKDLLDLASVCDGFLGYPSFFIPLSEAMNKRSLLVWSRRGFDSPHEPVRLMTPQKLLHRPELASVVMDDCLDDEMERAVNALCRKVRSPETV